MSMTIKQAFEKLTMVCGAALKNPFFVQRNLHDAFAEIAANIEGGGGGGSTVEVTQTQSSGNKIGTITVDGSGTDLYAPDPSLSISGHTLNLYKGTQVDIPSSVELPGDTVSVNPIQTTGEIIAEITVNNVTSQIKAPSGGGGGHTYSTTEQVVGKWVDGSDVYEKTINFGGANQNYDVSVAHGISNLGKVISFDAIGYDGSRQVALPFVSKSSTDVRGFYIDNTNLVLLMGNSCPYISDMYVVIRYTKATT